MSIYLCQRNECQGNEFLHQISNGYESLLMVGSKLMECTVLSHAVHSVLFSMVDNLTNFVKVHHPLCHAIGRLFIVYMRALEMHLVILTV